MSRRLSAGYASSWRRTGRRPVPIVVGVSGGPDSVALLRALCAVRPGPLVVAHLNHGLRGSASDGDAVFVGELARKLMGDGQPVVSVQVVRRDVGIEAGGENLEAAARPSSLRMVGLGGSRYRGRLGGDRAHG